METEGIFLTEAGAKSITVGLRELGELLLGGHLHGSRAGGAGVERLAHEGAGRAEGKGEGDGGELHGLKENLRGVMVGVSASRRWDVECVCVRVEAAAAVGSGQWAVGWGNPSNIERRKRRKKLTGDLAQQEKKENEL